MKNNKKIENIPIGKYIYYLFTNIYNGYLSLGSLFAQPKNQPIILPGGVELKQGFYQSLRSCKECKLWLIEKYY
ncbi:hypothetical protein RhiirA4_484989 [Rhizophagus irregularis]|uniref:Argonaute linker 1 domain-containing protein n=1 Tax=Rhizophagus irregularis TaxID=588596 RepID=A0A2I1HPK9_9GLOM|nr:hypothetical protein RhiirA4_484989 [Rhizophagus irregularis]